MLGLWGGDERRDAGHLIVGKVTDRSAILWMKGTPRYVSVHIRLESSEPSIEAPKVQSRDIDLVSSDDNTAIVTVEGLTSGTSYDVTALFSSRFGLEAASASSREVRATFRTAPDLTKDEWESFSFLLGSCNLSIVSINNLAARALQIAGTYVSRQSLLRPIDDKPLPKRLESLTSKFGRWWMRRRYRRKAVDLALKLSVGAVFVGTGGKWPRQPLLRSPFLKLEALFAGEAVHFQLGFEQPTPGDEIRGSLSGASGILAFAPKLTKGRWRKKNVDDRGLVDEDKGSPADEPCQMARGALILVDKKKTFDVGERLFIVSSEKPGRGPTDLGTVGYVIATTEVTSDYDRPAFTIHAGDQIYFDFPDVKRPPDVDRYHQAYREAWFEDRHQRAFLARGAHYMTLDDHEIVNDYSLDLKEPAKDWLPKGYASTDFSKDAYSLHAMDAYKHYVQQRQGGDKKYFEIDYGKARFFFLDTRTERRLTPDLTDQDPNTRMIGSKQMRKLKKWLGESQEKSRLAFIVSSVPFIAEVLPDPSAGSQKDKSRRSVDKWSGEPFRRQREELIDLISESGLQNLVFLVGDMHCAYHASMTIGKGQRWNRLRIHELAGGPINQLQHGRRRQFSTAVRRSTRNGKIPYDIRLHQFHSGANAIMHIDVGSGRDEHLGVDVPEIHWRVIRTMTEFDGGPWFEEKHDTPGVIKEDAPISGRIVMRPALSEDAKKGAA